jgi:hypothetical protein
LRQTDFAFTVHFSMLKQEHQIIFETPELMYFMELA